MLVFIHVTVLIITGLAVLYSDEQAFMWMLGKIPVLDKARVAFLHRSVSVGLGLLIITGGLLYSRSAPFYLADPTFIVKMVAIAALIVNTYVIDKLSHTATAAPFASLTKRQRMPLFVSGVVSVGGWATAALCGLFLG